jgi:pilus assembly protein CpaC
MREEHPMFDAAIRRARRSTFGAALRSAGLVLLLAAGIVAATQIGAPLAADTTHINVAAGSFGANQSVTIGLGKSLIVDFPVDVSEVIVSQPGTASAAMRSKRRAVIQSAGNPGITNIFFLDAAGRTIVVLDVSVRGATSTVGAALSEAFSRLLPTSNISVESVALVNANGESINRIVLSGYAATSEDVIKATTIAAQFAGSPDNVASVITVGGPQQVKLKVTVAEVQREAVKQLGINLSGTFETGQISTGLVSTQPLGGASNTTTANALSGKFEAGGLSLEAKLTALERHGALRTLSEPTLTAMSGAEAEFLAGGEFPVPSSVDDAGNVTYAYKEFGVKLKFTPTIKSDGAIGLVVDTSVSEPTTEGGFTLGNITIPATRQRHAKTTVELGVGQTLAIGGLMQDTVRQQINRMPGLGDIPILGALFRSRDFIRSQTELVILVTPYYDQGGEKPVLPTDEMVIADDAESIFLGHMERVYGVGSDGMRGSYHGAVGFLLD